MFPTYKHTLCVEHPVQIFYFAIRERVSMVTHMAGNNTNQVSDTEILEFYNLATSKLLTGLEVCEYIVLYRGNIVRSRLTN